MPTLSIWEIRASGSQNIPIKQLKCHLLLAKAKWANRRWKHCYDSCVLRAHCLFLTLAPTEVEQLAVFCYLKKCILVTNC